MCFKTTWQHGKDKYNFTFYSHQSYLRPNSMFLPSITSSIEKGAQRHITPPWFKSDGDVGRLVVKVEMEKERRH